VWVKGAGRATSALLAKPCGIRFAGIAGAGDGRKSHQPENLYKSTAT